MDIWTLYRGPTNHTKEWVVRLWQNDEVTDTFWEADTREECEAYVRKSHPGAVWLSRHMNDDPKIEGTWI